MIGYMIFSQTHFVNLWIVMNVRVTGIVTEVKVADAVRFGKNT